VRCIGRIYGVAKCGAVADPLAKLERAAERVRRADDAAGKAREAMMRLIRDEFAAGRVTKSGIARAIGVSRQRVQKMLDDR
jgi:hypothetical protein